MDYLLIPLWALIFDHNRGDIHKTKVEGRLIQGLYYALYGHRKDSSTNLECQSALSEEWSLEAVSTVNSFWSSFFLELNEVNDIVCWVTFAISHLPRTGTTYRNDQMSTRIILIQETLRKAIMCFWTYWFFLHEGGAPKCAFRILEGVNCLISTSPIASFNKCKNMKWLLALSILFLAVSSPPSSIERKEAKNKPEQWIYSIDVKPRHAPHSFLEKSKCVKCIGLFSVGMLNVFHLLLVRLLDGVDNQSIFHWSIWVIRESIFQHARYDIEADHDG